MTTLCSASSTRKSFFYGEHGPVGGRGLPHRALTAPGYSPDWHIGVRVAKTGKLIAFISGIKIDVRVRSRYGTVLHVLMVWSTADSHRTFVAAEVNFLCVHKKLRSKRLAPVLIKEVTRRVNLLNVWQAIYTGGVVIPTPIGTCRYYHRNLNPQKLVDIGFSAQPRSMTMTRMKRHYSVGTVPKIPGFRELTKADIPQVRELLSKYLDRFEVAQLFSKDEEVEHWFLSGQGREVDGKRVEQVVWAYVVEVRPIHPAIFDDLAHPTGPDNSPHHRFHVVLFAPFVHHAIVQARYPQRRLHVLLRFRCHLLPRRQLGRRRTS